RAAGWALLTPSPSALSGGSVARPEPRRSPAPDGPVKPGHDDRRRWERSRPSKALAQPQRVVDRGVDVAGGDGVADTVEEVGAVGVGRQLGGVALDEAVEVDLAAVAPAGAQLVVDLVGGQ